MLAGGSSRCFFVHEQNHPSSFVVFRLILNLFNVNNDRIRDSRVDE